MTRTPSPMLSRTPSSRNQLIEAVLKGFREHFAPQSDITHITGTTEDHTITDHGALSNLGVSIGSASDFPDVVLVDTVHQRIIVVEAVTSHGPISDFRRRQLADVFSDATLGIVYVTAFESRAAFTPYVSEISWETEVWLADAPTHLIHFDGKRFLGPYNAEQEKSATT